MWNQIVGIICSILLWYKKIYEERIWVKFVAVPLFFALPYTIAILYSNVTLQNSFKDWVGLGGKTIFIDKHLWLLYIGAILLSYVGAKLYDIAAFVDEHGFFNNGRRATFSAVWDKLVEAKTNRIVETATQRDFPNISKEEIFYRISRPDQQKLILANYLHECLVQQYGEEFKVRILGINSAQNIPDAWLAAIPDSPETNIDSLKATDSTISHCLKQKKMVIIESISKELKETKRHYVPTHEDANDDSGSMICIPCCSGIKNNAIVSIVIIWCKKEHFFKKREKKQIELIAKQIKLRIQLEQALEYVKE